MGEEGSSWRRTLGGDFFNRFSREAGCPILHLQIPLAPHGTTFPSETAALLLGLTYIGLIGASVLRRRISVLRLCHLCSSLAP